MDKMQSATSSTTRKRRRLNPHVRRELLTKRLLVGLMQPDSIRNGTRRPYSTIRADAATTSEAMDILSAWKEVSLVFPLLSYGDESKQLMQTLMGISESIHDEKMVLEGLGEVIADMIRVRRHVQKNRSMNDGKNGSGEHHPAEKRTIHESTTTSNEMEIVPWNVVLRVVIRFAAFAVKQMQSMRDANVGSPRKDDGGTCAGPVATAVKSLPDQTEQKEHNSITSDKSSADAASTATPPSPVSTDSQQSASLKADVIASSAVCDTNTNVLDVDSMHYKDIRSELSKRQLNVNGKLHQLKERLKEARATDASQSESGISHDVIASSSVCDTNTNVLDVDSMYYKDIRSELSKRQLNVNGKLHQLKERLKEARATDTSQSGPSMSQVDKLGLNEIDLKRQRIDNVDSLNSDALKRELQQRDLSCQGSRAVMVDRLKRTLDKDYFGSKESLDVESMSLDELGFELKKRGLSCEGDRRVLVRRLNETLSMDSDLEMIQKFGVTCTTFNDLRSELNKRGLASTGRKSELIKRLLWHLESANEVESTECSSFDGKSSGGAKQDAMEVETITIHPILQALDIVVSDLSIFLRTEQKRNEEKQQKAKNIAAATNAQVKNAMGHDATRKRRLGDMLGHNTERTTSSAQQQSSDSSTSAARDRMICDWKNRQWSGPSRYAFLKDVEFVVRNLDLKSLNISAEEMQVKVDTIVGYLDQLVGFDVDTISTPVKKISTGKSQPTTLSPTGSLFSVSSASSPFRRSPTSNTFESSRFSCRSSNISNSFTRYAEISRIRVNHAIEMQKESRRKAVPSRGKHYRPNGTDAVKPSLASSLGEDFIEDDDIGRLKDAYRMAITFSRGTQNEDCSKIKRRLELLNRQLNDPKVKQHDLFSGAADSYLRLLLRELLQPSDPVVWDTLLKESGGKETSMLLRTGRSSLVSFLVEINVPEWDDDHRLEPSPLADYLGYLSAKRGKVTRSQNQHAMLAHSSFLLPNNDASSMPPPPVVTEIGLGSCVAKFLEKEPESSRAGIDFIFGKRSAQCRNDSNLETIGLALPDVSELTRDLFDLTLRLAADDDKEHENKPFPLRLATSSASESLQIVLNVVTDNHQWLQPRAVSARYKMVIELLMISFSDSERDNDIIRPNDDNEVKWALRASALIKIAKTTQYRARIALYATQFMSTLCGRKHTDRADGSTSLYNHLHLQKFSNFGGELEQASDEPSNEISHVFDFQFCMKYLLPLSHQCSSILARQSRTEDRYSVSKEAGSALQLINILCTVFRLMQCDELLVQCVHVGWAIEVMRLSIGSFIRCDQWADKTPWHQVEMQLLELYKDTWEDQQLHLKKRSSSQASFTFIEYEHEGRKRSTLMPSFGSFVASLVGFACRQSSADITDEWCQFASSYLLRRYASVLPDNVAASWVRSLTLILRNEIIRHKVSESAKRTQKEDEDDSTERLLAKLMNPMLKKLHCIVINHHVLGVPTLLPERGDSSTIASVFCKLYEEESTKILTSPSPKRTRKWNIYRDCLEIVFSSTPLAALFASLSSFCLDECSADVLRQVCLHFGQSHMRFIMAAAGLAVNESLGMLRRTGDAKILTICDAFTSETKGCITDYFTSHASKKSPAELAAVFHEFHHDVGIQLQCAAASLGLIWWNDIKSSLSSLFEDATKPKAERDADVSTSNKRGREIERHNIGSTNRLLSCLKESLSAIARSQRNK